VSYPAIQPSVFALALVDATTDPDTRVGGGTVRGRILTDTSKLSFTTNSAGEVVLTAALTGGGGGVDSGEWSVRADRVVLRVVAQADSVAAWEAPTEVTFNLALDRVHGGIPATALPLIPLAALAAVGITLAVLWLRLSPPAPGTAHTVGRDGSGSGGGVSGLAWFGGKGGPLANAWGLAVGREKDARGQD